MRKLLLATAIAAVSISSTVNAGAVAYVAPAAPVVVEEAAPMGSSGAWIIPLIAIGLIALAISQDDEPRRPVEEISVEAF